MSMGTLLGIPSPKICWDKNLKDRVYASKDLGAKSLSISIKGYNQLKDIAFNILKKYK